MAKFSVTALVLVLLGIIMPCTAVSSGAGPFGKDYCYTGSRDVIPIGRKRVYRLSFTTPTHMTYMVTKSGWFSTNRLAHLGLNIPYTYDSENQLIAANTSGEDIRGTWLSTYIKSGDMLAMKYVPEKDEIQLRVRNSSLKSRKKKTFRRC